MRNSRRYFQVNPLFILANFVLLLSLVLPAAGQFRYDYEPVQVTSSEDQQTESVDPIPDNDSTVGVQGGRYGIGFASSWPVYGISGTIQVSETITGEAVLGFLGYYTSIGGRLWYRFSRNEQYDIYGFGGLGLYRYNRGILDTNSLVLGVGAGGEVSLMKLIDDEDFPPIFLNAELGLSFGSFDSAVGYNVLTFGVGAHYRFGQN